MTISNGTAVWKYSRRGEKTPPVKKHKILKERKYFLPSASKYPILNKAHKMVKELVFSDGPYRRKLIDLVSSSIEQFHKDPHHQRPSFRSSTVVTSAWNHLMYAWCPVRNKRIKDKKLVAFACMGTEKNRSGDTHFPVIAFSEVFKKNDLGRDGSSSSSTEDRKALLLFFRKIKREFLHLVQGYLEIRYKKAFSEVSCPERYQPHNEDGAGEHDEEEDSGGSIVPFTPKEELSNKNLLCLFHDNRYFPLSDKQVEALLDLKLYFTRAGMHDSLWTPEESRVRKTRPKIFTEDFLDHAKRTYYIWVGFIASGPRSTRGESLLRNFNHGSSVMDDISGRDSGSDSDSDSDIV